MKKFITEKFFLSDIKKGTYFPFLYYYIFWGLCTSPLKPYILKAYSQWLPECLIENKYLQWIVYLVVWFIFCFLAFGRVKANALNDLNKEKKNKSFKSWSGKNNVLIGFIAGGIIFWGVMKFFILPNINMSSDPITYTIASILFALLIKAYNKRKRQ